jgi:hypothetical protein
VANKNHSKALSSKSRISADSVFFNKIVPVILAVLGLATIVFIVVAVGVLTGFIPFK